MPALEGRTAVVTGANSGLGLAAARELAKAGARVVMACRSTDKGERAADGIRAAIGAGSATGAGAGAGGGSVEVWPLDLGDLASVEAFAAGWEGPLDLLLCNAGVMAPPRQLTADGFESQLGTNHLGHFALAGRLLPALLAGGAAARGDDGSPGGEVRPGGDGWPGGEARVVSLSSVAHRMGWIHWDDLQGERRYVRWLWYGQSKLATLMFALELARRAREADAPLRSVAAHPGYAATNLQFAGPPPWERVAFRLANVVAAQPADMGALPSLYASVEDVPSGAFVGPDGLGETRGHPKIVGAARRAYDEDAWRRLWEVSEELTGVSFDFSPVELAQN